jgi:DHA1 family quinolone resistance protein-like MFS transporter
MLVVGGAGMLAPIFAIFIEDFVIGGNEAVAGFAMAAFLIARSLFQIPIAVLIDKVKGEADDYMFMVVFSIASSLIPLLYLIISYPWQLYLVQILLGVATAVTYPSYMAIFTRHIDKHKEGTEWGIYYTLVDMSSAILAAFGGYLANTVGFRALIIAMVIVATMGSIFLIPIRAFLKVKKLF